MFKISEKGKRGIFAFFILLVFAYLLYIIISYYSSDRVGMVKLSYDTDDTNIVSAVYATYTMKTGEGNLNLSRDKTIDIAYPKGALSEPIVLKTIGKLVSDVSLELSYDDNLYPGDELRLILVEKKADTNEYQKCDFKLDTDKNTLTANVKGDGVWFLTTPEAIN